MRFLLLLALLGGFEFAQAAGTVTVTDNSYEHHGRGYRVVTLGFTSDASGDADKVIGLTGRLVKIITNPGTPAPTANYDVYVYETEDAAISLIGTLAENRHTTTTEVIYPAIAGTGGTVSSFSPLAVGIYTFRVANAGNGGQGRVLLYFE